ncbi:patatin-like phospholipase family protein [Tolypothrix sp. VBCCA 56010]|uniref:patatin-like phospholipase family protein n=1 Tax=Tolypothrix sp. VBCCA 56010 TaxID=3137731 RepID=UPI003D7D0D0F
MNTCETKQNNQPTYRILSLDGGGIRGLITAVWLHRLEQELGAPIRDHFNLIAGTSTGSILACGISLGKPASELIKIYKERGKEIFPHSPFSRALKFIKHLPTQGIDQQFYCDKGLQNVLKDEFKSEKFLKYNSQIDSNKKCKDLLFEDLWCLNERKLTTLVMSYDTLNRRAIPFNSSQPRYAKIPVWEICKASSSAPIFFPAHIMEMKNGDVSYKVPMIDGGVVASNPTACALAEGMKARTDLIKEQFVIVSLGTGDANRPISIEQAQKWGIFNWTTNITNILFDGVSQAVDHIATSMLEKNRYFRFQGKLERDSLDDVSEENLNALQAFANSYFETTICKDTINELKEVLNTSNKVEDKVLDNSLMVANNHFCDTSSNKLDKPLTLN